MSGREPLVIVYGREGSEATRALEQACRLRGLRLDSRPLEPTQPAPHRREALGKLRAANLLRPPALHANGKGGAAGAVGGGASIEIPLVDAEGELLQAPSIDQIVASLRARGFASPASASLLASSAPSPPAQPWDRLVVYSTGPIGASAWGSALVSQLHRLGLQPRLVDTLGDEPASASGRVEMWVKCKAAPWWRGGHVPLQMPVVDAYGAVLQRPGLEDVLRARRHAGLPELELAPTQTGGRPLGGYTSHVRACTRARPPWGGCGLGRGIRLSHTPPFPSLSPSLQSLTIYSRPSDELTLSLLAQLLHLRLPHALCDIDGSHAAQTAMFAALERAPVAALLAGAGAGRGGGGGGGVGGGGGCGGGGGGGCGGGAGGSCAGGGGDSYRGSGVAHSTATELGGGGGVRLPVVDCYGTTLVAPSLAEVLRARAAAGLPAQPGGWELFAASDLGAPVGGGRGGDGGGGVVGMLPAAPPLLSCKDGRERYQPAAQLPAGAAAPAVPAGAPAGGAAGAAAAPTIAASPQPPAAGTATTTTTSSSTGLQGEGPAPPPPLCVALGLDWGAVLRACQEQGLPFEDPTYALAPPLHLHLGPSTSPSLPPACHCIHWAPPPSSQPHPP
jgi:hypothetical protein